MKTGAYCFRIRFHLPTSRRISVEANEWTLHAAKDGEVIVLLPDDAEVIKDASVLILLGRTYPQADSAEKAGLQWRAVLERAFAENAIGADFGDRAPAGFVAKAALEMLPRETQTRVLNDIHGLMIFDCEDLPGFARALPASPMLSYKPTTCSSRFSACLENAQSQIPW